MYPVGGHAQSNLEVMDLGKHVGRWYDVESSQNFVDMKWRLTQWRRYYKADPL